VSFDSEAGFAYTTAALTWIDSRLEDLAGNSIAQAFDIDVFEHVTEHIASASTSLLFNVR